jgi:hypothetical protein
MPTSPQKRKHNGGEAENKSLGGHLPKRKKQRLGKADRSLLTPSPEKSRLGGVEVVAGLPTPSLKESRKRAPDNGEDDDHKRERQRLVEVGATLSTPSPENVRNGKDFSTIGLQDPEIELGTG